jgi:hypothetical protein
VVNDLFSFLSVEYSSKASQAEKKKRRAQKMDEDAESSSSSDDEELEAEAEIVEKANDAIQSMAIDKQVRGRSFMTSRNFGQFLTVVIP